MPFVSSVIASAPLLAYRYGFFTFLFIGFGVVLAGYAVYWMIFKVGRTSPRRSCGRYIAADGGVPCMPPIEASQRLYCSIS